MAESISEDDWKYFDGEVDIIGAKSPEELERNMNRFFGKKLSPGLKAAILAKWKLKEEYRLEAEQTRLGKETRRDWMSVKEDVKATGTPATLKENDKYQVRVVRHGKGVRTMVLNKNTGVALRRGSKREREALLGLI